MGPEEWYEMYVMPFHPERALVSMRVLSQIISGATGLRLLRLKKLVYIYSNRKAVAAAARDDKLKMITWDAAR